MPEATSAKKIKVAIFSGAYDTGGQGYRIRAAFERYQSNFEVRAIHTLESYTHYPYDLRKGHADVKQVLEEADILHMVNGIEGLDHLRSTPPRGLVVHHRGTKFRDYHARLWAEANAAGAVQIASTIDLTLLEPNVTWLPSPYEIDELASYRVLPSAPAAPIRFAHAPTNRTVKSTAQVLSSILELNEKRIPCVLDLIERIPWYDVIVRKGRADVYVDQLHLGYGNNAVEAWAMGIPVVAGVEDLAVKDAMISTWGRLPFYEADESNLTERLAELATDPMLRAQWGEVGREHVAQYHRAEVVSYRLASIYEQALEPEREGTYGFAK